jgi:hypothetical protein
VCAFACGFSEAEPELGDERRLRADQDHGERDWEVERADREPDRELVQADADPEPDQRESPLSSTSVYSIVSRSACRPLRAP